MTTDLIPLPTGVPALHEHELPPAGLGAADRHPAQVYLAWLAPRAVAPRARPWSRSPPALLGPHRLAGSALAPGPLPARGRRPLLARRPPSPVHREHLPLGAARGHARVLAPRLPRVPGAGPDPRGRVGPRLPPASRPRPQPGRAGRGLRPPGRPGVGSRQTRRRAGRPALRLGRRAPGRGLESAAARPTRPCRRSRTGSRSAARSLARCCCRSRRTGSSVRHKDPDGPPARLSESTVRLACRRRAAQAGPCAFSPTTCAGPRSRTCPT